MDTSFFTSLAAMSRTAEYVVVYGDSENGQYARTQGPSGVRWDHVEINDGEVTGVTGFAWSDGTTQGCFWTLVGDEEFDIYCDGTDFFETENNTIGELLASGVEWYEEGRGTNGIIVLCGGRGTSDAGARICLSNDAAPLSIRLSFPAVGHSFEVEHGIVVDGPISQLLEPLIPGATGAEGTRLTVQRHEVAFPPLSALNGQG